MSPTVRNALLGLLAVILTCQALYWLFRRLGEDRSMVAAPMNQYTKLGTLLVRVFGFLMVLYAVPMILVSIAAAVAAGSDGADTSLQSLVLWLAYGAAGALAYFLAIPIAQRAARGLEESSTEAPRA